ncbi:thioesterase family protein [Kitasatospora sp. LaBMicrA B282]|uniref:thioesterase family protein n=1 Tax=Kitasatospora sp. LaBMicrA B282 TaxID=3420949 RepID=UPI003D0EDF2B
MGTETAESFYRNLGADRFESTGHTAGPWSPEAQHAGPPSALLGRAFERHQPREGFRIARVTLDIPRPVPVAELTVAVRTVRSGGRSELLEGELTAQGEVVMVARAWRMAASPQDTPALRPEPLPQPLPGPQSPDRLRGTAQNGYVAAMEWRWPGETTFDHPGPGTVWARQRHPLVAGEADTPLTRALTLADSNWAVAFELDHVRQQVINTDVTLALHRDPVGEWLFLSSATAASPLGSGLALGRMDDELGDCGRVLQTLFVAGR